jgi:hypothetical protein
MEREVLAMSDNAAMPHTDEPSTAASIVERVAAPALFVPRLVLGMVSDIRSIAQSTRVIANLAENLASIEAGVEEMNREVHRMREGVDFLGPEVTGLRRAVEPLEDQLGAVRSIARIASRLPGGGGRAARRRDAEQAHPKAVDLQDSSDEVAADDPAA